MRNLYHQTLWLQIAQSRPYLYTLGPKVGTIYVRGGCGKCMSQYLLYRSLKYGPTLGPRTNSRVMVGACPTSSTPRNSAVFCSTELYCTQLYSTLPYPTPLYSALLYSYSYSCSYSYFYSFSYSNSYYSYPYAYYSYCYS